MNRQAVTQSRLWVGALRGLGGEEIGIDEIVSLHGLSGYDGDGTREHWAREGEGVELAALAAGIDCGGEVGEEGRVEGAAGEAGVEGAWVNCGETGLEAGGEHLLGEFGGGQVEVGGPDGEDRFEAGACEVRYAVGADVFEEEVAKGHAVEAFGDSACADGSHARLVVGVRAGERQVDLPERQARGGGLLVEELFAGAVDGYAAEFFVDGREEGDDFVLGLLAKEVEGPGAVFAAGPSL